MEKLQPLNQPTPKPRFKTRPPRTIEADPNEEVWGNGCERRGCLKPSIGKFRLCPDGIRREFCEEHQNEGTEN